MHENQFAFVLVLDCENVDGHYYYLIAGIRCVQADTPEGIEYGIEDGEIVVDESEHQVQLSEQEDHGAEYDPLMAGNLEVFLPSLITITCSVNLRKYEKSCK